MKVRRVSTHKDQSMMVFMFISKSQAKSFCFHQRLKSIRLNKILQSAKLFCSDQYLKPVIKNNIVIKTHTNGVINSDQTDILIIRHSDLSRSWALLSKSLTHKRKDTTLIIQKITAIMLIPTTLCLLKYIIIESKRVSSK